MKIIKSILTAILLLSSFILPVYAQTEDILLSSDIEMRYSFPNEYVNVKEKLRIKINNSKYFYRSGLEQTFYIPSFTDTGNSKSNIELIKNTLTVTDSNNVGLHFEVEEKNGGIEITTATAALINSNSQYTIEIEYRTADLISLNGNIANIYVPGLPKNANTQIRDSGYGFTVRNEYSARLLTNKDAPNLSHLQPKSIKVESNSESIGYTIPTQDRIGKNSWIQLGTSQYYHFRIEQVSNQTDFITPTIISDISDLASSNIYRVAIPREYNESKQVVLIKSINPKPYKIERDQEGNIFALFKMPANNTSKIVIEGYIQQSKPTFKEQTTIPDITLAEYKELIKKDKSLEIYLKGDKYWQIDDPVISKIATNLYPSLYEDAEKLETVIKRNYYYVVDNFDYDYSKLAGENRRLGAKESLSSQKGVCMEYSDSLTAIFRAQGIPARIAIGYGNDPTGAENKISNSELVSQNIAHQWTQIWIPNFGWLSIDPTWGESEREYIGSDLDHILWYTIGSFDEKIADTTVYTADSITRGEIGDYKVYLQALTQTEFQKIDGLQITSDLLNEYKSSTTSQFDFLLRTSTYGRILVYIIPAITVFTLVLLTTLFTKKVIKRSGQVSQG